MSDHPFTTQGRLLTPDEAGNILRVTPATVRNYCRSGILRHRRLPTGRYRIEESAVRNLLRKPSREEWLAHVMKGISQLEESQVTATESFPTPEGEPINGGAGNAGNA